MQTVLVVQCAAAGAVYLNGRLAGETDAERPLTLPVSPFGALLLEMRPFAAGLLPMALRIPLSQGIPLLPEPDDRLCAAVWPGGVVEIELLPERLPAASPPVPLTQSGELRFSFVGGSAPALLCETPGNAVRHPLPDGAGPPSVHPLPSGFLITGPLAGKASDGQYALILPPDASSAQLSLSGRRLSAPDGGNALRILRDSLDTVGHASLDTWTRTQTGWQLASSEPMWSDGAPHWPQTPEKTALAALEAAQLGLTGEAAAYFSPVCPCAEILARAAEYDGCTPLRHPLPDGTPAVGLMHLRGNVLRVTPVRYEAAPGGAHGAWQLTKLEIGEEA